ncbi:MAG: rod-binding protein [Selenomonadaceae bacterium]|nr:rod-binding protein [Selenomonadaceae bacterium]
MQISGANLIPQMSSTNTGATGAQMINDESSFQAQLKEATDRLEKKSEIKTLTDDELTKRDKEIKDASVQLEAIMLKLMYNEMWKTVPKNKLFGDDNAMEIYRDMYNEELTKVAAEGGGIGLADFIYRQLTQNR